MFYGLQLHNETPDSSHTLLSIYSINAQESKTQIIKVNAAGEGYCDVTLGRTGRVLMNPQLARQDSNEDQWFRTVLGHNVRLAYPGEDLLRSAYIESEAAFLPPAFVSALYTDLINTTALTDGICRVMEFVCPEVYAANAFSSHGECMERMESLPVSTKNKHGLDTVDGNSTGCRHMHASLALQSPAIHCPHLSFTPMEDKDGKVECSASNDFSQEDFFSRSDFNLFERVAVEADVNTSTLFEPLLESNVTDCPTGSIIEPEAWQRAAILPSNFFCRSFLESQDALGNQNSLYWGALVLIMIVVHFLAMACMRLRATVPVK